MQDGHINLLINKSFRCQMWSLLFSPESRPCERHFLLFSLGFPIFNMAIVAIIYKLSPKDSGINVTACTSGKIRGKIFCLN